MISISKICKYGLGIALVSALLLFCTNLAIGIIGRENNLFNLMHFGIPAVGISGFIIARYQPFKMALTMFATALAQTLVPTISMLTGLHNAADGQCPRS